MVSHKLGEVNPTLLLNPILQLCGKAQHVVHKNDGDLFPRKGHFGLRARWERCSAHTLSIATREFKKIKIIICYDHWQILSTCLGQLFKNWSFEDLCEICAMSDLSWGPLPKHSSKKWMQHRKTLANPDKDYRKPLCSDNEQRAKNGATLNLFIVSLFFFFFRLFKNYIHHLWDLYINF